MSETQLEHAEHHAQVQRELQAIISQVAETHLRGTMDDIRANLQRELTAAGHWPQPARWVTAVAEEMQAGHIYVVGPSSARAQPDAPRPEPSPAPSA